MADLLIDTEVTPAAPSANKGLLYFDSVSGNLTQRNSTRASGILPVRNGNTAAQAYTTTDVYVTGSSLAVPGHLMTVGMVFRWRMSCSKTAGTGSPVVTVRVGTAGAIGDTARVTFTQVAAGTSVTDTGYWDIECIVRSVGAAGVLSGVLSMSHVLATTGFSTLGANVMQVVSAGFDTTVAATVVGLSWNHSTAGAGNIEYISAECWG